MDRTSAAEPAHVQFALYHGSSSHYLVYFRPGETLSDWPHTRDALDELAKLDPGGATELLCGAGRIGCFLKETGRPILIEFRNVQVSGLSSERPSDEVSAQLAALANMDQPTRGLRGQQANFRLAPGCAIVGRVFDVSIDDRGNPVSRFQVREIVDSDLWTGA